MKRFRTRCRLVVVGFLVVLAFCATAGAKTVVILDIKLDGMGQPTEDGYLSNMEGYTRGQIDTNAGDVVIRGGSMTTALSQVTDGDTVVIIVHGRTGPGGNGFGFTWGGQQYTGFGSGPGQMPVPAGFNTRKNVTIEFRSCWSDNDPVGPTGGDVSLNDKILAAMGNDPTNTANGFSGRAQAPTDFSFPFPPGFPSNLETSYRAHLLNCLADLSWKDLPPKNRSDPPPEPNQESRALEVVQTCWENMPAGHILQGWPPPSQLLLEYGTPRSVGGESGAWRGVVEICGDVVFTIDQVMFVDSFEMGDTSSWSSAN